MTQQIQLSPTEKDVIRAFGYGLSRKEIAQELDLSSDSLDMCVARAYEKLHQLEHLLPPDPRPNSHQIYTL